MQKLIPYRYNWILNDWDFDADNFQIIGIVSKRVLNKLSLSIFVTISIYQLYARGTRTFITMYTIQIRVGEVDI